MNDSIIAYHFDNIILDLKNRQLRRNGDILALTSKYFDVLAYLVKHHGELATKKDLFNTVWSDVIVTDTALSQCIKDIRKQLGDNATQPRYIKTVPKHGYIFICDVREITDNDDISDQKLPDQVPVRPYKFLDYYTENDAKIFFGREEESQTIASKILAHRTFVLHGRSGVGKSSVIQAGVIPILKKQGYDVYIVRSFIDPLGQLSDIIAPLAGPDSKNGFMAQVQSLSQIRTGNPIIFIFDQFEEFFSILSPEKREQFISEIKNVWSVEPLPLRFVFVLREDLLAEISQLKNAIADVFHYEFRLKRLTKTQASKAITEPARLVGCDFEKELIDELLKDLSEQGDIDPPQLQIVCDALYDDRDPQNHLTIEEYHHLGGAKKILAGYLERVLGRFDPDELDVVKKLLMRLISEQNQRMIVRQSELENRLAENLSTEQGKTISGLITELIAARIIRCRRQEGESWIELAHDFLLSEISSWMNVEEYSLKRAYGIIERALENFRLHNLLLDLDALNLVMPYGERLGLAAEESDLLARSLLSRSQPVPEWLALKSFGLKEYILETLEHESPETRISGIQSACWMVNDELREKLIDNAFWDKDLMVRKEASIVLAEKFSPVLRSELKKKKLGLKRRAISMAFIRDHDKNLIHLSRLPFLVAVLVVLGLMLVRFRRSSKDILVQTLGGTLGAALSGMFVGMVIGIGLILVKPAPAYDRVSMMLVLTSLGTIAGAFGGFGVSAGMVSVNYITFRHSRWWSILGAVAGGAVMGAFLNILGIDILKSLFGHYLHGLTGAFEGALIGFGLSAGILFTPRIKGLSYHWSHIIGAAVGAMLAAVMLTLIGGNLFSGSLDIVARSFSESQVKFDRLALIFGESQFGQLSRLALGGIEGMLFGGFLVAGIELIARNKN